MPLPRLKSIGIRLPAVRGPGLGSMSRALGAILAAAYWILLCLTIIMLVSLVAMVFLPLGDLNLTASSEDGGTAVPVPRAYLLFGLGAVTAYFGGFALISRQLRRMVHTLRRGDPFHPDNVGRLRQIGLTLAVVTGGAWIGQTLVSRLVRGAMEPPGVFDLVTPAFSLLVVFVLAEVFREGARLRRESELTI